MKIMNIGSKAYTNYIIQTDGGAVLVDCGNGTSYQRFLKALSRTGIHVEDIRYVILTHVHADHLSYMNELLHHISPTLIVGEHAVDNIAILHDRLLTYSSRGSKRLSEFSARLRGGPQSWQPISLADTRVVTVTEEYVLEDIGARVIPLSGHTLDSIGILFDSGDFFVGDAVMNMFPARHMIPLLIENAETFKHSFEVLTKAGAVTYYPGHGGAFQPEKLLANAQYAQSLVLY